MSSLPTASRELTGLCIGVAMGFVGFSMTGPLIPLMITALGGSPGMLGLLMSITTIGSLLAAVPSGVLIQRYGTRSPVILASLGIALSFLLLYLVPSMGALFIALTLFKLGQIIFIVAVQSHVANLGEGRDHGLDFGWYGAAAAAGQLIGPSFAGLIMDCYGKRPTWAVTAVVMAFTGLAFYKLIGPGRRERLLGDELGAGDTPNLKQLIDTTSVMAILASFVVIFAVGTRNTFYPVYLHNLGFTASVTGAMMSIRAFSSILVRSCMGGFVRMVGGRFPAIIISLFSLALGIGSTPFCRHPLTLSLNSLLVGFGIGMALPLSMATVADGVPPEKRGMAMGVRLTGNRLAELINPLFFGIISQWWGISTAFWTGGIILALVTLPILIWWARGDKAVTERSSSL